MPPMDDNVTAQYWNDRHFDPSYAREEWSFHPVALARMARLLGYRSREEWFWARYLQGRSNLSGVGIGVGLGRTELALIASGVFEHYDLYDMSERALDAVRRHAVSLGIDDRISFRCQNFELADPGNERYDVVTFIHSLHHIVDLDKTLASCKAALKPGGRFWAVEYIGPDHFQYPAEHTAFARRFYRTVHPGLKKLWTPELTFPTREEVIAADPTEAIHSADIPGAIHAAFDRVETIYTYGSFAFMLFWGLLPDALYESPLGHEFVETLLDIDTMLIDSGRLPHYFAYFVATK